MQWSVCFAIVGLTLVGCAQDNVDNPEEQRSASELTTVEPPPVEELELTGVQAYELACASCHESGLDGAPASGDTAAWSNRSTQWEAVLFNHAKSGYFAMPAKGGMPELSDRTVSAAAEYMLSITYPDLPIDD